MLRFAIGADVSERVSFPVRLIFDPAKTVDGALSMTSVVATSGVTALDAPDAGPAPTAFRATTVKV